jgi:hypothetical protein
LHVRRTRTVGYATIALGILFLMIGAVMPYYKSPQNLQDSGPNLDTTPGRPYVIQSYILPPIDAGQRINLSLLTNKPGSTAVLLAPYNSKDQTIATPILVNAVFAKDQKGIAVFTNASRTATYILIVTSYNSSFTFILTSVWSPFYELRSFTVYALAVIPLGLVIVYYDGIVERRQRMFEEALRGIGEPRKTDP